MPETDSPLSLSLTPTDGATVSSPGSISVRAATYAERMPRECRTTA